MNLSQEDANLFYKLMWGLQFYVSRQLQVLPKVHSVQEYAALPMPDKMTVRDALWKNPKWIDAYLVSGSEPLSDIEGKIIRSWNRFIADRFQIFRFLKDHTIFIGQQSKVFGVVELNSSLADIFAGQPLPILVETVLLPFNGQIIYDGILRPYNMVFGKGIRSDLNETYMKAKQNGRIITTLEPEATAVLQDKIPEGTNKEWVAITEEIVKATERMRGGPAIQSASLTLLRTSARVTEAALKRVNEEDLWQLTHQTKKALHRLQTVLERMQQ